ncbi:hypothetical protein EV715DRAFT_200993 [Schizophyllum commune]
MAPKKPAPKIPTLKNELFKLEQARLVAFTYPGNPTNYESPTYTFWTQFFRIMSFYTEASSIPSPQHAVFGLKAHDVDNVTQQLSSRIPGTGKRRVIKHWENAEDTSGRSGDPGPSGPNNDALEPDGGASAPEGHPPQDHDHAGRDADTSQWQASAIEAEGDATERANNSYEAGTSTPEREASPSEQESGTSHHNAVASGGLGHFKPGFRVTAKAPERSSSSASENRSQSGSASPSVLLSNTSSQHTEPGTETTQRIPDTCLLIPYTSTLTLAKARKLTKARMEAKPADSDSEDQPSISASRAKPDRLKQSPTRNPIPIIKEHGLHDDVTLFIPVLAEHKGGPGRTEEDPLYEGSVDKIQEEAQLDAADQGRIFLHNREYFGYQNEVLLIATVNDWYTHTTMKRIKENGMFRVQMEPWSRRILVGSEQSKKREAAIIAWINKRFGPDQLREMAKLRKKKHERRVPTASDDEHESDHGSDADYLDSSLNLLYLGRIFERPDALRGERVMRKVAAEPEIAKSADSRKRKRVELKSEEECAPLAKKVAASVPSTQVDTHTKKPDGSGLKRGVRFADGEPLAPVTDEVDPEEASANAAAAAVTIEYLASRPNESWTNIKEMPIPPEARPHLEPILSRDRKGRLLARYSVRYALVFSFEVAALHRHLQRRQPKYRRLDAARAMHALVAELHSALGIKCGNGITHSVVDDRLVYTFIMSKSNRPETLPYPAARVRKFQEIINHPLPPIIIAYRPETVSPLFSANAPRQLMHSSSIAFVGNAPATISPAAFLGFMYTYTHNCIIPRI